MSSSGTPVVGDVHRMPDAGPSGRSFSVPSSSTFGTLGHVSLEQVELGVVQVLAVEQVLADALEPVRALGERSVRGPVDAREAEGQRLRRVEASLGIEHQAGGQAPSCGCD